MNEKIDMVSLPKKSFWHLSIPIIAFCIFDAIYLNRARILRLLFRLWMNCTKTGYG